jgi:peptide chain release factor subunit 1
MPAPCACLQLPAHRPAPPRRRYGFIVMDGNGSLFGTLSGNTREVMHKFTVDLPKKHGRGGQSALRFARLRMEKRHNYVRKVRGQALLRRGAP